MYPFITWTLAGILWLCAAILMAGCAESNTEQAQDSKMVALATSGGPKIYLENQQQARIVRYYYSLLTFLSPSDSNMDAWRTLSESYRNQGISRYRYYESLISAKEAHHGLYNRWYGLEGPAIPEGIDDVFCSAGYVLKNRGDAMSHMAKAVDTNSLEELRLAETDLREAESALACAIAKTFEVAANAGLNVKALDYIVFCDKDERSCRLRSPLPDTPLLQNPAASP